jgi:tetraacyldisaccharide 4'-kinase
VLGFAGIGFPEKFFASLEETGAVLAARRGFADHHPYTDKELRVLAAEAARLDAMLVTTAKDAVRLPGWFRPQAAVLGVALEWENPAGIEALLDVALSSQG